jgi:hypothetical protein
VEKSTANSNRPPDKPAVKILSAAENYKYFNHALSEEEIIDVMSDLKHRIFPRPFERLSSIRNHNELIGAEIGVAGGPRDRIYTSFELEPKICSPNLRIESFGSGKCHQTLPS